VFFKAERELVGKLLMNLLRGHHFGHSSVMDIVNTAGQDSSYCVCILTSVPSIFYLVCIDHFLSAVTLFAIIKFFFHEYCDCNITWSVSVHFDE
jgi:hypothetical protein